ncbi:hypothetical protein Noda2021_04320 [Candidatus Dependentiae bacterium Noda2021]|nr:hypothetical protein Noda2021_04320 [Candidatus Dependentiae bacterium Noda2021]
MFHANGMDEQRVVQPIDVIHVQYYTPELKRTLNNEEFKALYKNAETGDKQSQFYLGVRYLKAHNPLNLTDLNKAEDWLIKSQRQDYVPAYIGLIECAKQQENPEAIIKYAQQAVKRGLLSCGYYVAKGYELLNRSLEAVEYYQAAYDAITKYPDIYFNSNFNDCILAAIAKLWYFSGDDHKKAKAIPIFKALADDDHIEGIYLLAMHYMTTNSTALKKLLYRVEKDIPVPHDYCSKFYYNQALSLLGFIIECDTGDIERAKHYYKKSHDEMGKYFLANLVLLDEMEGDKHHALECMDELLARDHDLCVSLFCRYIPYLISHNKIDEALALDKKFYSTSDPNLVTQLQLAIAYAYGHGVKKDSKIAQIYFDNILNSNKTDYESKYVTTGYMHLFGLGVKKDISRGMQLIEMSQTKIQDLKIKLSKLFPLIETVKDELAQKAAGALIKEEKAASQKKKKNNTNIKKTDSLSELFEVTPQKWNSLFKTEDGSYVSEIKKQDKTFTIFDPKRNEQLIVQSCAARKKNYSQIESLNFHKRIMQRKGKGGQFKKLSHKTIHDHDFAQMLDYVIQYIGKLVPFAKPSSTCASDELTAPVTRHNLITGQQVECNAEYGFGERDNDVYVYHRLLRPIKNITTDNQASLPYKS